MSEIPSSARPALRRDAERNRRRILAAATELIEERGLDVSHDEIARRAAVGVGTVYRRFPTREALFDALFQDELDVMVATAEAAGRLDDPWEAIHRFLEGIFELQAANRGLRELLVGHGGSALARRAQEQVGPAAAALVARAHAAGCLRPDVGATDLAMIPLLVNGVMAASREVQPDLWRRWLAVILEGIATGPRRPDLPGAPPEPAQVARLIRGGR